MLDRLTFDGSTLYVHLAGISAKATKSFTHGTVTFDVARQIATFGKLQALDFPEGFAPTCGDLLKLQLVAPDGTLRRQTREGVLTSKDESPGILRIAGMSKTSSAFTSQQGWQHLVYKYRAYSSHPGVEDDGEVPLWLKLSIGRQRSFWNRLAYLCREARRKCSPVPTDEIAAFVQETILPKIDAFNKSLGRARTKEKIKHPAKLKIEMPGLDGIWKFAGTLRHHLAKRKAVPDGLLEEVVAFAEKYKASYVPLDDFEASLDSIAKAEAKALGLRRYEFRPTYAWFRTTLNIRKAKELSWSEGWPRIKYPDSRKSENWGLHYYFNKAGVESELLESGLGVPGLTFGSPISPTDSGHGRMVGRRKQRRSLRGAEISIPGDNHQRWSFRFSVLQHRPLPRGSHLKEWKLLFQDGKLWLCLVVELQMPVPTPSSAVAGLDIGWRRTKEGIRLGALYEPTTGTHRELLLDFQKSPTDTINRTPFRIDLGPTRWDRRNIRALIPERQEGDPIPNPFEMRSALQTRQNHQRNLAKNRLRIHLAERLPAWFERAGRNGLIKIMEDFKEDEVVCEIIIDWQQKYDQISRIASHYLGAAASRLSVGQTHLAHDVCRLLRDKGITRLIVKSSFPGKLAQAPDEDAAEGLKRSQKYRQFAAPGRFLTILKNIAVKYGIVVDAISAVNTTRICHQCNHVNPSTGKEQVVCEQCGAVLNLDQNAAINLSRFGSNPILAEWALTSGKA